MDGHFQTSSKLTPILDFLGTSLLLFSDFYCSLFTLSRHQRFLLCMTEIATLQASSHHSPLLSLSFCFSAMFPPVTDLLTHQNLKKHTPDLLNQPHISQLQLIVPHILARGSHHTTDRFLFNLMVARFSPVFRHHLVLLSPQEPLQPLDPMFPSPLPNHLRYRSLPNHLVGNLCHFIADLRHFTRRHFRPNNLHLGLPLIASQILLPSVLYPNI